MFSRLEEALLIALSVSKQAWRIKKKKNYWDKVRGKHDLKDFL